MAADLTGTWAGRSTLLIAPGRRYRWRGEDRLSGCDGERSWSAIRDGGGWAVQAADGPEPPLRQMLRPSWLLTGFTLEPSGPVTAGGRDALRVVARPRRSVWGWDPAEPRPLDRVEVAVDAELGILLRLEEILDGETLSVTELTSVGPAPAGDDARFLPPGGWDAVRDDVPPATPGGPAWEAAKLATGLAAGGLGALIGCSRFRPFEQATQEEPEAEMPPDEGPPPADGPPVSDEVLHLLHASRDRWAPGITAMLHQWHDVAAMLAQIPADARRAGFGGLGRLIDTAGDRIATLHLVSRVRLDGSGRYAIEPALPAGLAGRSFRYRAETIICDGERRWRIAGDEVIAGAAAPPPHEIADLFDASWLLEHRLSGGAEIAAGGRRGYRLGVAGGDPGWAGMFSADDVVVDAELGILLRLTSHAGSTPVTRFELREVVAGDPGEFVADIPAGARVTEEAEGAPGPVNIPAAKVASLLSRRAAIDARSAVRSVLGVIRRENPR